MKIGFSSGSVSTKVKKDLSDRADRHEYEDRVAEKIAKELKPVLAKFKKDCETILRKNTP